MWVDQRGSEIIALGECLRLLAVASKRGAVGRLALSRPQAPIVQPVNFAYRDHAVIVRLGEGTLADEAAGNLVAFEADHVDLTARQAWSVLVRGLATELGGPEISAAMVAPTPLVALAGDRILAVRTDVVTGRRFELGEAPRRVSTRRFTLRSIPERSDDAALR